MKNEDNPNCVCGHKINRSHVLDQFRIEHSGNVSGFCKFCDCKEICIE